MLPAARLISINYPSYIIYVLNLAYIAIKCIVFLLFAFVQLVSSQLDACTQAQADLVTDNTVPSHSFIGLPARMREPEAVLVSYIQTDFRANGYIRKTQPCIHWIGRGNV